MTMAADLAAALELLEPDIDAGSPEYPTRKRIIERLFAHYREKDAERALTYIDALWTEVPVFWLALAVKTLIAQRVYPSLPTPGDVRRAARELAGMDRTRMLSNGIYDDSGHHRWPPPRRRHAVTGGTEPLDIGAPALESGEHAKLEAGE